jgi:hypothetical protein
VNEFIDRYTPRWLYLSEFLDALPGTNADAKKEAVIMLIRDRMIVDGKLDEAHFRFLGGKPQIESAYWLMNLSDRDFSWTDSSFQAPANENDPSGFGVKWFPIEIAASALSLFKSNRGERPATPRRHPPEQARALRLIHKIYGGKVPTRAEVTDGDLVQAVNAAVEPGERPVGKDSILRAAGRRKSK